MSDNGVLGSLTGATSILSITGTFGINGGGNRFPNLWANGANTGGFYYDSANEQIKVSLSSSVWNTLDDAKICVEYLK